LLPIFAFPNDKTRESKESFKKKSCLKFIMYRNDNFIYRKINILEIEIFIN